VKPKARKSQKFVAPLKQRTKRTPVEDEMDRQLREAGITDFERNVKFIPGRRFEADFYWPHLKLALEVDGGIWLPKGGHTSGEGYTKDRERDIEALLHGIITVRVTSTQVNNGYAIEKFKKLYAQRAREKGLVVD